MSISDQSLKRVSTTDDRRAAPAEVFYVVQTTGGILGRRHHRLRSRLFETPLQARAELARLAALTFASGASYGVWNSTTYVEPAEWSHDVELEDGTVIQSGYDDPGRRRTDELLERCEAQ